MSKVTTKMQFVRMQTVQSDANAATGRRDDARGEHEEKIDEVCDLKHAALDEMLAARSKRTLGAILGGVCCAIAGAVIAYATGGGGLGIAMGLINGGLGGNRGGQSIAIGEAHANRARAGELDLEMRAPAQAQAHAAAPPAQFDSIVADAGERLRDSERFVGELRRTQAHHILSTN